jgi:Flp pilus assembly pilin Flp
MDHPSRAFDAHVSGATAIEYALMASLIAITLLIALNMMTINLVSELDKVHFENTYGFEVSRPK